MFFWGHSVVALGVKNTNTTDIGQFFCYIC